jgi:hypothetical protein
MDPLFVAGCLSKLINPLLCHFHPIAYSNFAPNGGLHFFEIVKDAHLEHSFSTSRWRQVIDHR